MIPRYLYRGDSDQRNARQLRSVHPGGSYGYLLTNLSDGGSGREIFNTSLVETINRHVDLGWAKTHFLSFSESLDRAKCFAAGRERHRLISAAPGACWNSAVITLDTRKFSACQQVETGVYRCSYPGRTPVRDRCLSAGTIARIIANAPRAGSPVPVLLIDVVGYIRYQLSAVDCSDLDGALHKAMSDFEWLILPLGRCENVPGELTSKLDDACISKFECYKFG